MMAYHWEDHPEVVEGCFGCKVMGLQVNAGDAKRDIPEKKWNAELKAYEDARRQGIQPNGTSMAQIQAAHKASETLGRAYDGDTMPKAHKINNKVAQTMKEVGM